MIAGVILTVRKNEQTTPIIIVNPTVLIGAIGEINKAEKPIVSVIAHNSVAFPVVKSAKKVALGILLPSSLNSTILLATCKP